MRLQWPFCCFFGGSDQATWRPRGTQTGVQGARILVPEPDLGAGGCISRKNDVPEHLTAIDNSIRPFCQYSATGATPRTAHHG